MQAGESGEVVELAIQGSVAIATLNRPEVRNAFNEELRAAFSGVIDRVAYDDTIRALVITGAGKGFCSGGDIKAMAERMAQPVDELADPNWRRQRRNHHLSMRIHNLEKVTIAAVNGVAAGLGCDMAMCCDFVVAAEDASFMMSFILRGLTPDFGGMYFLPRRIGLPRAKELIFTGRRVDAVEALAIGMADRVVAPADLVAESVRWAEELSQHSRTALGLTKAILDRTFEMSPEDVMAAGAQAQAICYTSKEHRDSVNAFLNRPRG